MKHTEQQIEVIVDHLAISTCTPRGRFSAEATRPLLDNCIVAWRRRRFLSVTSAVAAVALVLVLSVGSYFYLSQPALTTISTLAETQTVHLPDGSRVTLNRYTTLSYPEKFTAGNREVTLQGEAYFDVTKDKEHPFIVQAEGVDIRVLGTEFNVQAYPKDEVVKATLFEGSVAVDTEDHPELILVPGESALYNRISGSFTKAQVSQLQDEIVWQQGALIFNNLPLDEIARQLSNAFDITIRIANDELAGRKLTARFIHGESIESIMNLLQTAGEFTVQRENQRQFILTPQ